MKHDLVNQPNEYEMVDFVWTRFRSFLGKGGTPPKTTQVNTTKTVTTDDTQSSSSVKEFPDKIDK